MDISALLLKIFGADNIGDVFSKIVGTFKLSPEKAAELESLKEQHAADLAKMQMDVKARTQEAVTREVEAASANIRAEATNGDKFASRARPTFLYVCNVTSNEARPSKNQVFPAFLCQFFLALAFTESGWRYCCTPSFCW